jgi:patatin-like phospholipase/acyl hydrolase
MVDGGEQYELADKLDINPDGKKMIRSIDGGGMRGAITIAMLAELEAMTGQPCCKLFDMVAGTSTGAIIAAAICVGKTAQEILDQIYKVGLPKGFSASGGGVFFWLRYAFTGFKHLYNLEPFVEALGHMVAGKKIGDHGGMRLSKVFARCARNVPARSFSIFWDNLSPVDRQ